MIFMVSSNRVTNFLIGLEYWHKGSWVRVAACLWGAIVYLDVFGGVDGNIFEPVLSCELWIAQILQNPVLNSFGSLLAASHRYGPAQNANLLLIGLYMLHSGKCGEKLCASWLNCLNPWPGRKPASLKTSYKVDCSRSDLLASKDPRTDKRCRLNK